MPYEHPEDLYYVWRDYGPIFDLTRGWLSGPDVAALDADREAIVGAVGMQRQTMTVSDGFGREPEELGVLLSSPELFELLGVPPAIGRGFTPDEVGPNRAPVVVLAYDLWRRRFNGDVSIMGSEVRFNGEPFIVIGVASESFHFVQNSSLRPAQGADAYITFDFHLADRSPTEGGYAGLIRARPGTMPEQVAAAVDRIGIFVDERDFDSRGLSLYSVGLKSDLVSQIRPALVVLGVAGTFLLLVLALNLATLLLVRAAQREREFAVSRALGASRITVARRVFLESGLLGILKRFSNRPCTTWGGRGTFAHTDAGGPMRAYSMDLRERALLDSDAGMKAADVAAKYRVSGSWVRLLKQRRRETGEVAPRVQRHGRRCMLEPHLHTLAALIAAQPDRTLAELKDALATPASVPTVWRAVRALGLTVKKNGPPVRTRSA